MENSDSTTSSTESSTDALLKQRGAIYGGARPNLGCTYTLRAVYTQAVGNAQYTNGDLALGHATEDRRAHDEAIGMVLHKIARIATGYFHPDNYDDLIGYAVLAKELAEGKR